MPARSMRPSPPRRYRLLSAAPAAAAAAAADVAAAWVLFSGCAKVVSTSRQERKASQLAAAQGLVRLQTRSSDISRAGQVLLASAATRVTYIKLMGIPAARYTDAGGHWPSLYYWVTGGTSRRQDIQQCIQDKAPWDKQLQMSYLPRLKWFGWLRYSCSHTLSTVDHDVSRNLMKPYKCVSEFAAMLTFRQHFGPECLNRSVATNW